MGIKEILSDDLIKDLSDYVISPFGFVLLAGDNGRGKSYSAMHVYSKLTPFKLPAFDHEIAWFVNQVELEHLLQEERAKHGNTSGLLNRGMKAQFLVLDDLGCNREPKPALVDLIYAIVDKRYSDRHKKGTIITTNLNAAEIRKSLGDPILSRIASGRIYKVIGPDRRMENLAF